MKHFSGTIAVVSPLLALSLVACGSSERSVSRLRDEATTNFWTYEVRGLPPSAQGCQETASKVAQRFTAATGIAVYNADCTQVNEGYSVTITYAAAERANAVSAVFGLFGSNDQDPMFPSIDLPLWGVYDSFQSCTGALADMSADFERETGLSAVASSCYRALESRYVLRIDGFGEAPTKRFYNSVVDFQGNANQTFADEVSRLFERAGASMRYVTPWGGYVIAMFYAASPLHVDARTLGVFGQLDDMSQCRAELAEATRALTEIMGQAPALNRCLPDSSDGTAYLNFAFSSQTPLPQYWEDTGPTYSQYATCATDRSRLVAFIRQSTGRDARGSVCVRTSSVSPSTYKAVILGK